MTVKCFTYHGVWGDQKVCRVTCPSEVAARREYEAPFAQLRARIYAFLHSC